MLKSFWRSRISSKLRVSLLQQEEKDYSKILKFFGTLYANHFLLILFLFSCCDIPSFCLLVTIRWLLVNYLSLLSSVLQSFWFFRTEELSFHKQEQTVILQTTRACLDVSQLFRCKIRKYVRNFFVKKFFVFIRISDFIDFSW